MCGGHKLSAGSFADVAIALTDFFMHDGLDLVPSDVAAGLICLMTVQRQKQITYKHELLREGGILAKDLVLATRLWRQFMAAYATVASANGKGEATGKTIVSLQDPVSDGAAYSGDIEKGLHKCEKDGSERLDGESLAHNEGEMIRTSPKVLNPHSSC